MTPALLDTNVISELTKPKPDARVIDFLNRLDVSFVSVLTLHELRYAIAILPIGARRQRLEQAIEAFMALFERSILNIGHREAYAAADMRASAKQQGRVLHIADFILIHAHDMMRYAG